MARPQSLKKLQTQHLKCRSWMHAWEHELTTLERIGQAQLLILTLRCTRCGTKRTDEIRRSNGQLEARAYTERPKNYLIDDVKSWGGRVEFNNNVRLELVNRTMKGGKRGKK